MATYKQVGYGSRGSEVTELQKLLNQKGNYNLATDGIYGDKTQAAVKDYQQKNNLSVDGIAGNQTWGSLTAQTPTPAQQAQDTVSQQATPTQNTVTLQSYQPSDAVLQAQALLQQQMAGKPGDYSSLWQDQINQQVNQILTRDPFSYDVYADPTYRQYADQYTRMGQLASMDAMGQAAALTGGYGNSYGQSVGNQAYFNYLNQLNDVVPELYSLARNNYDQEGQAMKDRLSMLTSFENQDYSRYNDQLNQWLNERNYLTDRYETERNNDYSQFADQRNMDYQLQRDAIEDDWRQKEWDLSLQKYLESRNSGGGSGGSGSNNNTKYKVLDYDERAKWEKDFMRAQSLSEVEWLVGQLEPIIGPEAAAGWYDYYAAKFYDKYSGDNPYGNPIDDNPVSIPFTGSSGNALYWKQKYK